MSRSSRSRSRPRMSAAERREQLLDVALEILCDQGAEALSIDAIAKGAGITRPVVYTQFGDLPGLLHALVEREEAKVLQQLAKAIPVTVGEVEPDDVIVNAIAAFLSAVAERPRTWQIVLTPPQGMPRSLHDKVVERREAVVAQITPLIAWGVTKRGGPAGLDHRLLARIILVLAEEAGRLVISQPGQYPPEHLVAQARVLVASLGTDDMTALAATPVSPGMAGVSAGHDLPAARADGDEAAEAANAESDPEAQVETLSTKTAKDAAPRKTASRSKSRSRKS